MLALQNLARLPGPTLDALGIRERSADRAHDALLATGWDEIGQGYHGSVHAHPAHSDLVIRLARKADGFGDYVALLRSGFAGSDSPHAPRVYDMHVSRCGALMTISARLSVPDPEAWWLPYAHAVIADAPGTKMDPGVRERFKAEWPRHEPSIDDFSFDGIRERFRSLWPLYERFVTSLRAVAPQGLDPNVGNVLVGPGGAPVVNDPLCDDGHGLWQTPVRQLARLCTQALSALAEQADTYPLPA